jgi:predicted amidohydrolase
VRVTAIELPSRWGGPADALAEVDEILAVGPPTDLALLPEMSLTGYVSPSLDFDLTRFAEPIDGPTATKLAALAKKYRTNLFGPLVLFEGDAVYNATLGFTPEGERSVIYRKRHPWIPEEWATPGAEPHPLFEIDGKRITIACCYDIHFVADEAASTLVAADILLFPSAWVEERDSRPRRLRALAHRFNVAIIAANWGEGELLVGGQGGSAILDHRGDILARAGATGRADSQIG